MIKRKIKAYIFYAVIVLVTLSIVIILRSGVIENLFKDRIAGFLSRETGVSVSIGRIDISILSSSVTLSSLKLQSGKAYRAHVGKLTLVFEPPSVLTKKPVLRTVSVSNAAVSVLVREKLPGAVHGKTRRFTLEDLEKSLPVAVQHVVVSNASLFLSMTAYDSTVAAAGVSMDVYPDLGAESARGVVDVKGLVLSRKGSAFTAADAQFSGIVSGSGVRINSLRLRSEAVSLVLSGTVRDYDNPELDVRVKASAKNVEQFDPFLKTVIASMPGLSGSYTFDGTVKGNVLNPSSSGTVGFQDMNIGGVQGGTGTVTYTLQSQKLTIKAGDVNIAGGRVRFSGNVDLSDEELPADFSLDLKNISFGELLYALTVPRPYVDAGITGKIAVSGTFNPIYFTGTVQTQFVRFSVYDASFNDAKKHTIMVVKPVDIESALVLTDRCAYITRTTVRSARSIVHSYTALYFTGAMFLTFDSTQMDLRDVSPIADIPYTGLGGVKGFIAGPFTDIVIHGDVSFHDYSMEHIRTGSVTGGITFSGDTLSLESVRAVRGESKAYVNGGITFSRDVELHMGARFGPVALADVAENAGLMAPFTEKAAAAGRELSFPLQAAQGQSPPSGFTAGGYVSGSARIDGPVMHMNGYINLEMSEPDFYWQSFDKGSLKMTMDDGRFRITRAVFTKGNDELYAGGYISEDGSMDIGFHARDIGIDNISLVSRMNLPARASVSFSGGVYGRVKDPSGIVSVELRDLSYAGSRLPDSSASVSFSNGTFLAEAKLFDEAVAVNGTLRLKERYPFEFAAAFRKLDVMPFLSVLAGIPITSDITGRMWMSGKLGDVPGSLVGYLYLNRIVVGNQSAVLENSAPVFMDIAKDSVYFRNFAFKGKNSTIVLKGFYNLHGAVNTVVAANVDLAYLPVFTGLIAGAAGKLRLEARVFGGGKNVTLNGSAYLNGDATFSKLPVTLSGVHMSVLMANNSITLKDMSGTINSGTMSGSGRIITSGLRPRMFDLSFTFRNMNFVYDNTVPMKLEGEIGLKGLSPRPVLEGNVKVVNAAYTDYINWEDEMLQFQHRRYEPKSMERTRKNPLKLNITVSADNSIIVDNNIINSVLSADLRITGDVDDPVIVGNISTNEGRIYYRSNTFTIDNAIVTYTQEHPHNPFVDLRASTATQQYLITTSYNNTENYEEYRFFLTIAGQLDRLNINLTSDPSNLDEMDIISLLTYGVPTAELMKNGMSSAAAYEVGAAVGSKLARDIFSELVGNENVGTIRKYFWVDNLQVEPYYPYGASSSSVRLTVTKRLSNDFNIQYSYDLSGYNYQRFQGEYRLSRRLYLVGNWDNSTTQAQPATSNNSNVGNLGGDLKYKFEF